MTSKQKVGWDYEVRLKSAIFTGLQLQASRIQCKALQMDNAWVLHVCIRKLQAMMYVCFSFTQLNT